LKISATGSRAGDYNGSMPREAGEDKMLIIWRCEPEPVFQRLHEALLNRGRRLMHT
jgi:hypothetical protein